MRPDDPFGHDMKGFLLYRLGKYGKSIDALEEAVALDPEDGYAWTIMARDYTMLARKAKGLNKERYADKAREMQARAEGVAVPDGQRLAWLEWWMGRRL
jgi:tetratricopeptide (TPR) repeat protein